MTEDVGAAYFRGRRELTPTEKRTLSSVTIVGLQYYPKAYEKIGAETRVDRSLDQCLYLVADVSNPLDENAVMLHNGKSCLGYVVAFQARDIKMILNEWKNESGSDDVVIVRSKYIGVNEFCGGNSVQLTCEARVNERLARKYSDVFRKEK